MLSLALIMCLWSFDGPHWILIIDRPGEDNLDRTVHLHDGCGS